MHPVTLRPRLHSERSIRSIKPIQAGPSLCNFPCHPKGQCFGGTIRSGRPLLSNPGFCWLPSTWLLVDSSYFIELTIKYKKHSAYPFHSGKTFCLPISLWAYLPPHQGTGPHTGQHLCCIKEVSFENKSERPAFELL